MAETTAGQFDSADSEKRARRLRSLRTGDALFYWACRIAAISVLLLLGGIIVSLVVGTVIAQGRMPDIDQPVLQQLPEYADLRSPQKDKITVRHLLTMSQGLEWDEDLPYSNPANSENQMDFSPDPVRYALSRPVVAPPGAVWNYSTGSAMVLSALLRKATGQSLDALTRTVLFEPLGISDYEWAHLPSGEVSPYGIRMRPRDLAKIGQLVLDRGRLFTGASQWARRSQHRRHRARSVGSRSVRPG